MAFRCFLRVSSSKFEGFRVALIIAIPGGVVNDNCFVVPNLFAQAHCRNHLREYAEQDLLLYCAVVQHSSTYIFISEVYHYALLVLILDETAPDAYFRKCMTLAYLSLSAISFHSLDTDELFLQLVIVLGYSYFEIVYETLELLKL